MNIYHHIIYKTGTNFHITINQTPENVSTSSFFTMFAHFFFTKHIFFDPARPTAITSTRLDIQDRHQQLKQQ